MFQPHLYVCSTATFYHPMARLTPGDMGDPDLAAPATAVRTLSANATAHHATAKTTSALPLRPCNLPEQLSRSPASSQATSGSTTRELSSKPGVQFEHLLLSDYYSTAIPGAISPSPRFQPAYIWLTPSYRSARFNALYVSNLLSFMLAASPARILATEVCPLVFRARLANPNVANVVLVRGCNSGDLVATMIYG